MTHIAIEDALFIEYREYFSEKSEMLNESKKSKFSSSGSSKQLKTRENENLYHYVNEDWARITVIKKDTINKLLLKKIQFLF